MNEFPKRKGSRNDLAGTIRVFGISLLLLAIAHSRLFLPACWAVNWKTGAEFRKQLDAPVGVTWREQSLRPALRSLSETTGIAIWLDRRLDPDQKLVFSSDTERFEKTLQRLAGHLRAGVSEVGSVVYIGPTSTASKLNSIAQLRRDEANRLSPALRAPLLRSAAFKWEALSSPRDLLATWQTESTWRVDNASALPHDLWPSGDFPSLSGIERLTLVLAGFDLTFSYADEGKTLTLVPMPDEAMVERVYSVSDGAGILTQLKQLFPEAKVRLLGAGQVSFAGTGEQHNQIARMLKGEKIVRSSPGPTANSFTLNVQNQPLGGVAKALAKELGLELKIDPGIEGKLSERISFGVKNASLKELLEALCKSAGASYRLEAQVLTLLPAAEKP